jgi:hypothetical protein
MIHHIIWTPIPGGTARASHFAPRTSRLASRVSRERELTQPRRSHTEKHREGRAAVCPRCRAARGLRRRDGRTAGPRGHTGGGRFLSCRGCKVRAHAQLDHPSRGSAPVDPCSPCNPWLRIGLPAVRRGGRTPQRSDALRLPSLPSLLRFKDPLTSYASSARLTFAGGTVAAAAPSAHDGRRTCNRNAKSVSAHVLCGRRTDPPRSSARMSYRAASHGMALAT